MAGSATVLISAQLNRVVDNVIILKAFGSPLTITIIKMVPFLTAWILFSFIYGFMPNTKVNWKSAIIAGIAAGTCYQLLQESYIIIQMALSRYNTIYGSFSALPLFLIWLQLSWLIVLFGAEVSFAHQNIDNYENEINSARVTYAFKKKLMIQVAASIVQQFETQQIMPDDVTLAANCKLPIRQVRDILFALQNAGIIIKSGDDNTGVNRYVPGLPTNVLTVQTVIDRVESSGENLLNAPDNHIFAQVSQSLEGIKESAMKSDANRLLKDLI
jgi:membrane protein